MLECTKALGSRRVLAKLGFYVLILAVVCSVPVAGCERVLFCIWPSYVIVSLLYVVMGFCDDLSIV